MPTSPYASFQLPQWKGPELDLRKNTSYGQVTGGAVGGNAPTMRYTTPSTTPEIKTTFDRAKEYASGLGGKFKETFLGDQQNFNVDTLKNMDKGALQESIANVKLANEARALGINPDGTPINPGLLGRTGNFLGSDLAKGLGTAFMGAAQLGLGYKSYKEGKKLNNELIQDMRTNRANLAADRKRAAKDRETFSRMMNTL